MFECITNVLHKRYDVLSVKEINWKRCCSWCCSA